MAKLKSPPSKAQFCVARHQGWPCGILSEIAEGVWSVEPLTYETVYVNPAIEKIYDRYSKEFYEKPQLWSEVIHPLERDRVQHSLSFLRETDSVETQYHILRPSGEMRLIRSKCWAIRDEKGKLERLDCIQSDISDRVQEEGDWQKLTGNGAVISYEFVRHADGSEEFTYISPNCREVWEIEPQERKSINLMGALIHPGDREAFGRSLAASEKTLKTWKQEWRHITPSGKIKWFCGIAHPQRQANGDVIWDGLVADITAEKQQEKAGEEWLPYPEPLKKRPPEAGEGWQQPEISQSGKSYAELEQLFNLSSTLLCIAGLDGYFKRLNPAWEKALGYDTEEMLSYPFLELVHPEDVNSTLAEMEKLGLGSKTLYFENRFRCKDGSYKWLAWTSVPVLESGLLYAVATDITDRKHLEAQRDKLIASLEESRERYRSVLAAIAEGIIMQDASGSIRHCNESAERILGLSAHQLLGLTSFDPRWQAIREDGLPFPVEEFPIQMALQTGQTCTNRVMGVRKPDGTLTWILVNAQPLFSLGATIPHAAVASFTDITELKQAEKALQASQRRYQILADSSPAGIFHTDSEGNCTYINQRWSELSGLCLEEAKGTGWSKTLHPEDRDRVFRQWYEAAENKQPFQSEYRFARPDGSTVWVIGQALAEIGDSGEVVGYVGTITDISDRKRVEAALQQALEEQQRTANLLINVINTTTDWIFAKDLNFRYILVNRAMADGVGMTAEEIVGKNDLELGFPEELVFGNPAKQIRGYRTDDIAVLAGETLENPHDLAVDASGVQHIFDTKKTPLRDANGRIFGILGCSHEITTIKKTEDALRRSEAQFRELAQRETLLNRLASQIRKSLNLDTILETATEEIRELLHVDRCHFAWYYPSPPLWKVVKEAKSTDLPSQLVVYPCLNDSLLTEKLLRMESIRIDRVDNLEELPDRTIYQELGYASLLLIPMASRFDCFGVVSCSHSIYRPWLDSEVELLQAVAVQIAIAVTQADLYHQSCESAQLAAAKSQELEATLSKLRQTQANLVQAEKMSSLGQLVAGIAHEINNPVNFIYGNLIHARDYIADFLNLMELYREAYPKATPEIEEEIEAVDLDFLIEDLPKILDSMQLGAERIREIVKSLRIFSRLDEAEMKEVDLHENIDSTLMILQHRLKAQPDRPQIHLIKRYGDLPQVECYAGQLNQVFVNIIANAIDAIEEKHRAWRSGQAGENAPCPVPVIEIETAVVDSQVQIRMADSGNGIPADVIDKIFDPFYTTKPIGSGTGLGLSISYQIIVERHRGSLRCTSDSGKGTEFIVEIPLQVGKEPGN